MSEEIRRRKAASGRVDHAGRIVVHESTDKRVEFVPFFIPRSNGEELAGKIVETKLRGLRGPRQTSSISLSAGALKQLEEALGRCLAVTDRSPGRYLVIEAGDPGSPKSLAGLRSDELLKIAKELIRADSGILNELVQEGELAVELAHAIRTRGRLKELEMAVDELRTHLSNGTSDEATYQRWCEAHSWAFGNAHVVNDEVRTISATDKIDILLPRSLGGFRDLIELKRPDMPVIFWDKGHRNWYWSSDSSKAIGQCHRYLDVLHSDVGLRGLRDDPDVVAYHPRATIVIGRSMGWEHDTHQGLHGLNSRLANISIITFDHLLNQAESTLALLRSSEPNDLIYVPSESGPSYGDDEDIDYENAPPSWAAFPAESDDEGFPTGDDAWFPDDTEFDRFAPNDLE